MRILLALAGALTLASCGLVYKLPTRQGNVIEQKQLDQLKTGMTREQVRFLLGSPLAASPFREERWDYLGYYKSPRGQESHRTVTLHFESERLARIEGLEAPAGASKLDTPDVENVIREEKKAQQEKERGVETPKPPAEPAPGPETSPSGGRGPVND